MHSVIANITITLIVAIPSGVVGWLSEQAFQGSGYLGAATAAGTVALIAAILVDD